VSCLLPAERATVVKPERYMAPPYWVAVLELKVLSPVIEREDAIKWLVNMIVTAGQIDGTAHL
jgi:hypothetical protein